MPRTVEHIVMMGDSLSDRGTMDHRKLFGIIPMDGLSHLKGKSPKGRFTNGYVWDDELSAFVAEEAIIKELKRKGMSASDIADSVIAGERKVEDELQNDFYLDEDRYVKFKNQNFVRNYDEGGLTAYDYHDRITVHLKLLIKEKILSRLDQKRELLLQDDEAQGISREHKEKTLVIEWSGANDLVTVNEEPTIEEADKAVAARIHNVEMLIKSGYRNFALFNLPDLSLTPRFQSKGKSDRDRENTHAVSMYFNERLTQAVHELSRKYADCSIDVFDVNRKFTEAYNNPKKFYFDPAKKNTPFIKSPDFKLLANGTSPAQGYMFWDDVHPSAGVHAILGDEFYRKFGLKYDFKVPHESLIEVFRERYGQKILDDRRGCFGFMTKVPKLNYKTASLEDVLDSALYKKNTRARDTIVELGWIDKKGQLVSQHPSLVEAMAQVKLLHEEAKGKPTRGGA